jgi:hypothetical protein
MMLSAHSDYDFETGDERSTDFRRMPAYSDLALVSDLEEQTTPHDWKHKWLGATESWEGAISTSPGIFQSALVGELRPVEIVEKIKKLSRLCSLISRFHKEGFSIGDGDTVDISQSTKEAAISFLHILPESITLPKISPDGESGLVMAWKQPDNKSTLLTVDGWLLHLVLAPADTDEDYLDDITFDGSQIPMEILDKLSSI